MFYTIYYVIIVYFLLGAIGFYFINRKKPPDTARQNWLKYVSYFIIINALFFSIVVQPVIFTYLAMLIVMVAIYELFNLFVKSGYKQIKIFLLALVILGICSLGFYTFSILRRETILFAFLILSIFDSFSQISGQLFGRKKLLPTISPNKTMGGVIGGAITALISAVFLRELYPKPIAIVLITATGIIVFAFLGDLSASWYKRKFHAKDFSNLIPGHGGFLDRFDSLIAASAWMAFIHFINF
ncbi:MAG: phosphatidate cytidylyltransferase [Cyclobacteriaceae bacterium]